LMRINEQGTRLCGMALHALPVTSVGVLFMPDL
jgi:hypothetical protein